MRGIFLMVERSFATCFSIFLVIFIATSSGDAQITNKPAPTPSLLGRNLIKNSDAETGNGSGWTNSDELKTIVYGEYGGGPGKDSPGPVNRGEHYFYARTTTEVPTVSFSQKIDLSALSVMTDSRTVAYNFGGWFGVANGSSSAARLIVTFLDKAGKELATASTAGITEQDRPADEVLAEKNASGEIPAGTREIKIVLEFKIFPDHPEHQDNLAFADNLQLTLSLTKKN
jgi:hypothetical protein